MKVLLAPKNPQLLEVEYPFINDRKPFGEVRVVVDSALLVQEIRSSLRLTAAEPRLLRALLIGADPKADDQSYDHGPSSATLPPNSEEN